MPAQRKNVVGFGSGPGMGPGRVERKIHAISRKRFMKTKNKTRRALAVTLMVGGLASASLTQAIAQPPSDDGSVPVIDGAASIKPQWTYGEQPEVGSRQPVTAEPKVDRPDTTPCTVQLFTNRKFVPKDGAPPQDYDYTPSAECAGPWSKVVLESDFRVDPDAALYDKTAQLFLGGVTIYYGTTAGPGNYQEDYPTYTGPNEKVIPQWHEENDLTEYSALFTEPQDGKVHVDNDAWQGSYFTPATVDNAVYMDAKLVFYPVAEGEAAPVVADEVLSLDPETDEGEVVWNDDQSLSYTFDNLPRNLERVYLDVQREGQRGDEFYNTSRNSADGGMGVREFEVKVDGRPAGVVPAYPYKYTYSNGGGYQNRNWAPVPAVSAFNFISYRVDLSPFAGVLSDGEPHTVSVNGHNLPNSPTNRTPVFGSCATAAAGLCTPLPGPGYVLTAGSFWYLTGNLVMYRDHGSETTSGEVTVNTLTPVPNLVVNTTSPRRAVSTHDYVISGYVNTSHGKVVTTLDQKIELDTNVTNSTSTAINQLTEYVARTTVTNGEDTSSTTVNLKYIDQSGVHRADGLNTFGWTYAAEAERNGDPGYWVQISDLYTTVPSSDLAQQRYVAFDSAGRCYDRTLEADVSNRRTPAPAKQASITGVSDGAMCDNPLDVEVTTAFRTLAGNAYLSVSAVNNEAAPVDVTLTTPYGSKTFSAVQPGRTVSAVFNARATSVDAGQVSVSLAGTIGGKPITATKNVAFEAFPD
ncbi:peptide-N4-asparagine amidase [Pseudactinotalea sp. HY158]|uniref:peptide-N4-asparagine amidase n=1 Tax=Pseudactinotalea sp. HY158 TaxID=2654547 RepID=UPI00129CAF1B|nr:peptide-N4-asparagine amidase [Pseudactinotalea sp. HY158]QGH68296.1 hypothetical protein GCE65_01285 [Pseudactinotalea sp. HY158]